MFGTAPMSTINQNADQYYLEDYFTRPGILIVDAEPAILQILEKYFQYEDFQVWTAENISQARQLFTQHRFQIDLLLLEVEVGGESGLEFWTSLQKEGEIRCVLMSAGLNKVTPEQIKESGAEGLLSKPFKNLGKLSQTILELIHT